MERCKLEIEVHGKSLLQNTIEAALAVPNSKTFIVSGAYPEVVNRIAGPFPVSIIDNPQFHTGIASSIQTGFQRIQADEAVDSIIVSVADQPFIHQNIFERLLAQHQHQPDKIIVSAYRDTFGIPCLFPRQHWHLINEISGDVGAKKILKNNRSLLSMVEFAEGWLDLDRPSDLEHIQNYD